MIVKQKHDGEQVIRASIYVSVSVQRIERELSTSIEKAGVALNVITRVERHLRLGLLPLRWTP